MGSGLVALQLGPYKKAPRGGLVICRLLIIIINCQTKNRTSTRCLRLASSLFLFFCSVSILSNYLLIHGQSKLKININSTLTMLINMNNTAAAEFKVGSCRPQILHLQNDDLYISSDNLGRC